MIKKLFSREIILYVICGALTTLVNIVTYHICCGMFDVLVANAIAWVASVLFAYVVNKIFVFQSKTKQFNEIIKELLGFFGGRIGTLLIESLILFIFVTTLGLHEMIIKIVAQFIVLVLNFIISKLFVFKKKVDDANNLP